MAERPDTLGEVEELTNQFYVTLRACVARVRPEDETRSPRAFQQIQDLLNGGRAVWSDAYQIEQLMVDSTTTGSSSPVPTSRRKPDH
jgi:hypothetical protein